jgi:hypothetical protein
MNADGNSFQSMIEKMRSESAEQIRQKNAQLEELQRKLSDSNEEVSFTI